MIPKIEPPIRKGIDMRKRMLTLMLCAKASSPPQQTAHPQDVAGSNATSATPLAIPHPQ
jgi:hypothetical protein